MRLIGMFSEINHKNEVKTKFAIITDKKGSTNGYYKRTSEILKMNFFKSC